VQINNVEPEITRLDVIPNDEMVRIEVEFNDPGLLDGHTVLIEWGDGDSTPLALPIGDRSFQQEHSYAVEPPPGGYSVTVTLSDDDTGSDAGSTGGPPSTGPGRIGEVVRLPNGDLRFGFATVPGTDYRIEYSHDLMTWFPVAPIVPGTGNRVQWIDEGPPATMSDPSSVPRRFYRYVELDGVMPAP